MAAHMAIADSRFLWAEVDRLKSHVHELTAASRLAHQERNRTAELLASYVTRAQLDAALSTKVSQAQVEAQLNALRMEQAALLDQKAGVTALISLQNSKLDVSVFDANAWDLQKLRTAMEQHLRDLFASFAGQVEQQVSSKLAVEDFIRVFNPESNGQKAELDTAATRISKMTDQLESLNNYVTGDRQRQKQLAELNVNMLDLSRKQTATRNSIVQMQATEETATAQIRAMDEQMHHALANVQSLTEALSTLQTQTQEDKRAQDARQAQLLHNVNQLEARDKHLTHTLGELQQFAHGSFSASMDAKLKTSADKLHCELAEVNAKLLQNAQQVKQRMSKTSDHLLQHKERLEQLDACMRKLAGLLRDTQSDLDNVKGPLATLATNLHEENVAILHEIERSQNGTRDIMLDYQDLLEREKSTQLFAPLPSRPSSSSSNVSNGSTSTSRKHKQQMVLVTQVGNRPQTSSPRSRAVSTPNGSYARQEKSAGAIRTNRSPSMMPWRAQTAGAALKLAVSVDMTGLSSRHLDDNFDGNNREQEVRAATPTSAPRASRPLKTRRSSSLQQADGDLFHFPPSDGEPNMLALP